MPEFATWDARNKYEKPCSCGCSDPKDCSCNLPNTGCKECSCCKDGLVEWTDETGKVRTCVTPNDYQGLMITSYKCSDGYIKAIDANGDFVGCLPIEVYTAWLALQTP